MLRRRAAETEHDRKLRKIRRVERAVSHLQGLGLIYRLGGARVGGKVIGPRRRGEAWGDCSAFAIYLCEIAGLQLRHRDGWTLTLSEEGHEGESDYLTLFIKEPAETEGHVIVRLRHHPRWRQLLGLAAKWRWAECGGMDNPRPGDGPTWFRPTDERIAEFPVRRCFAEL